MPIYVYGCKCGHETESLYNMSNIPDSVKCEKCGKKAERKYDVRTYGYVKGNGIVKDPNGARREREIGTLRTRDPYRQHRESGEVGHIEEKLQRAGKSKQDLLPNETPRWVYKDGKVIPDNEAARIWDAKHNKNQV